jgi:uncharacterized Zn finger protein
MTDDRVRGFPRFPPETRRGRWARSWWGNAWIRAMEDSSLDLGRLSRGRTYARAGRVDSITVSPGRLAATVQGSRPRPYRAVVVVEELTDAEWERFLDQVASRAGFIAALLDNDMPPELVEAAADAGVKLLPGIGDLDPECTCPDWGYPCKHAAALCYQAARLLDEDPFVLLLLRGRGESELLAELQRRNARWSAAKARDLGSPAAETPAAGVHARTPGPLPPPPTVPAGPPGALPPLPQGPGVPSDALALLVADAAARARELLVSDGPPPVLDERQDAVRLTASQPNLVARVGRSVVSPREVRAWEYGGAAGLEVLDAAWTPPKQEVARALAEAVHDLRGWRNRWTVTGRGVQLRYGRDRRWYPYREEAGEWWPSGPPGLDAPTVLDDVLGSDTVGA